MCDHISEQFPMQFLRPPVFDLQGASHQRTASGRFPAGLAVTTAHRGPVAAAPRRESSTGEGEEGGILVNVDITMENHGKMVVS